MNTNTHFNTWIKPLIEHDTWFITSSWTGFSHWLTHHLTPYLELDLIQSPIEHHHLLILYYLGSTHGKWTSDSLLGVLSWNIDTLLGFKFQSLTKQNKIINKPVTHWLQPFTHLWTLTATGKNMFYLSCMITPSATSPNVPFKIKSFKSILKDFTPQLYLHFYCVAIKDWFVQLFHCPPGIFFCVVVLQQRPKTWVKKTK